MFTIFKEAKRLSWKSYYVNLTNKGLGDWFQDFKKFWEEHETFLKEVFEKVSNGWAKFKKESKSDSKPYYG